MTPTPEEGGLCPGHHTVCMAVKMTQPDDNIRGELRADYAEDTDSLTAVSQVVATNYQTVAQANNYWRD